VYSSGDGWGSVPSVEAVRHSQGYGLVNAGKRYKIHRHMHEQGSATLSSTVKGITPLSKACVQYWDCSLATVLPGAGRGLLFSLTSAWGHLWEPRERRDVVNGGWVSTSQPRGGRRLPTPDNAGGRDQRTLLAGDVSSRGRWIFPASLRIFARIWTCGRRFPPIHLVWLRSESAVGE
jgi:hypothetical protein